MTLTAPVYLSPKAAGDLIGVAPQTLARWRCQGGGGPPFIKVGSKVRYAFNDITEWMNSRRVANTSRFAAQKAWAAS